MTDRTQDPNYRSVTVQRLGLKHYRATSPSGASLEFGQGPGLLSPVELLLAAVAGCSSVDVDVVTSRRAEPEDFRVLSSAIKQQDEGGAVKLDDLEVSFRVSFPASADGAKAQGLVDRLIKLSAEKDCTVSRTVEHPTKVTFINELS